MKKLYDRLYIGDQSDCTSGNHSLAVVHACKSPCHQEAVGYKGSLPALHPNYLSLLRNWDLFLNLIDTDLPLFMPPSFSVFMDFAREHYAQGRVILCHCNRGESRAPSLALLFLAKELRAIDGNGYPQAALAFGAIYPSYNPKRGIVRYLTEHWEEIE